MSIFQDRRVIAALGAGAVVVVAVGLALMLSRGGSSPENGNETAAATASSNLAGAAGAGELKVEMGKSAKLESDTSVRCFVHGQFVGMETAAACAQKNGVAPGALDVGLDQSGAIAAGGGDTHLQPLANTDADTDGDGDQAVQAAGGTQDPTANGGADYAGRPPAECKRYSPAGWKSAGGATGLDACVHTLFDGRCPPPGQVVYGHWGALTLRASPGRIDVSPNNRDFHPLAPQYPADCSIPPI